MAIPSMFLLLVLSLYRGASAVYCDAEVNKTVTVSVTSVNMAAGNGSEGSSVGCDTVIDDRHYWCKGLQDALDFVSSRSGEMQSDSEMRDRCGDVFDIQLESGVVHVLKQPVTINSTASVYISTALPLTGTHSSRALVACTFDGDMTRNITGGLHSLYFIDSSTVVLSDIDFTGCQLPIRVYQANNVIISNSTFKYFTEAVLDIHNSINVSVHSCVFSNNRGSGIIKQPYRGNTGGLAITYNSMNILTGGNPSVTVTHCNFTDNTARPRMHLNTDQIHLDGILTGRGGGMAVFAQEYHYNISVYIHNCYYYRNTVPSFGGGLYILFKGSSGHSALLEDNVFEYNRANLGGGGMIVYSLGHHQYTIRRCVFKGNVGNVGGGLFYSTDIEKRLSNVLILEDSVFEGNQFLVDDHESYGAAIVVDVKKHFEQTRETNTNIIHNCTFINNVGSSSIISIVFYYFEFTGTNTFINNTGTTLRLFSVSVLLNDRIEFTGNKAQDGSAIQLLSFSQLLLADGLQLLFTGNIGRFGACITVSGVPVVRTFQNTLYNPTCFLLLKSQPSLPPTLWHSLGINISFMGNSALFGSAIFVTSLAPCSWVSKDYFDVKYFPQWPIFNLKGDNRNSAIVSDPFNQSYSIATDSIGLSILTRSSNETALREVWPGRQERFHIQSNDELDNPTGSIVQLVFSSSGRGLSKPLSEVSINPSIILIRNENFTVDFSYDIANPLDSEQQEHSNLEITFNNFGVLLLSQENNEVNVSVKFTGSHCAGGYVLRKVSEAVDGFTCQCDETVDKILLCENDQDSIIIQDNQWASVVGNTGELFFHQCPLGYCRCFLNTSLGSSSCSNVFVNSDPNRQCVCGRQGILCGECSNDNGVTVLMNTCRNCNRATMAVVPFLILIVMCVMVAIVFLDKPLPQWAHPVTFFIQVGPIVSMRFPYSFVVTGQFVMYVSSFLSFYFPYDFCLHNGIKSLHSYVLRFIPVTLAILMIPPAIVMRYFIRRRFNKLRSLKGHGIWTISLLIYTHTTYTAINILNCPSLPDENSYITPRWYVDGSVQCFKGSHLPLALFAMFCLLLLLLIIPLILVIGYKPHTLKKFFPKLGPIDVMVKTSFKTGFQFWYGVELVRRLLIVFTLAVAPSSLYMVLLIVMCLLMVYGYYKPYVSRWVNYLEMVLLTMFLTLLAFRMSPFFQDVLGNVIKSSSTTSIPDCRDGSVSTHTGLSILLSSIYYTPILISVVCMVLWTGQHMWKRRRNWCNVSCKKPVIDDSVVFDTLYQYPDNYEKWERKFSTSEVTIN